MTREEKDEVIELLRCAADLLIGGNAIGSGGALGQATTELVLRDPSGLSDAFMRAFDAEAKVLRSVGLSPYGLRAEIADSRHYYLLEAAQRLEESD